MPQRRDPRHLTAGLPAHTLNVVLTRAFYSAKDTRTPVSIAICSVVVLRVKGPLDIEVPLLAQQSDGTLVLPASEVVEIMKADAARKAAAQAANEPNE